jgi:two-component system LytT family response regulator
MPRTLLIDDEPLARDALRVLLAAHSTFTVVGEAATLANAAALLARDDYDLVFLDIQLRGGTGFDLVPAVRPAARIIFVTAHDEHALRAFDANALDYLLKPVSPARLATGLARLTEPHAPSPTGAFRPGDTVYLKIDTGARFVPLRDLVALLACENYSEVFLASGEKLLVRRTLKLWADLLPAPPFARTHRGTIVNLSRLTRIEEDGGDAPLLHLHGLARPLRASRREWAEVLARAPLPTFATFRP